MLSFGPDSRRGAGVYEIVLALSGVVYRTNLNITLDNYTHQYTLILKNDRTFQFFYDEEEIPEENIIA